MENKATSVNNSNAFFYVTVRNLSQKEKTCFRKKTLILNEKFSKIFRKMYPNLKNSILEYSITICGDQKIKNLNYTYRNKNKKTDVLSFQMHSNLKKLKGPYFNLGDIFICHSVLKSQSLKYGHKLDFEFLRLSIHGLMHLSGLDHEKNNYEYLKMQRAEKELMDLII